MINILANDGISESAIDFLKDKGFNISNEHINQEGLVDSINKNNYEVILVRSATKIRKELIDKCPCIKLIGRGGVGMDNIDVEYAIDKGIKVINTPKASSLSVAELVFAHLFGMVRFLYDSNRKMPMDGEKDFKKLKKSYSSGKELFGKTIGIIGFGRIGQEVARIAIALGMNVLAHDKTISEANITLKFYDDSKKTFTIETDPINTVLKQSDFITLHIPKVNDKPIITSKEIKLMKTGAGIVNTSRGGLIDEDILMFSLEKKKLAYAALDVFTNEPTPSIHLLMQENISITPHIGAATREAQERVGIELAEKIIKFYNKE